jgi:hypothetical protein
VGTSIPNPKFVLASAEICPLAAEFGYYYHYPDRAIAIERHANEKILLADL